MLCVVLHLVRFKLCLGVCVLCCTLPGLGLAISSGGGVFYRVDDVFCYTCQVMPRHVVLCCVGLSYALVFVCVVSCAVSR